MSQDKVPDYIVQKYYNNPAAFTKHFTNIWYDENGNGAEQELYKKQLMFLNAKRETLPKIVVVLKPRQSRIF